MALTQKSRKPGSLRYYGWKKQAPDQRDLKFHANGHVMASLPSSDDLTAGVGVMLDQSSLGSCGPNSVDSMVMFDQQKENLSVSSISRLFVYYNTRDLMGTTGEDSGVDNRTMLKALNQQGFCDESLWPYDISTFTRKPSAAAYSSAVANRIQNYAVVEQTLDATRGCIASGFPFLFGFTVYESFESDTVNKTGIVPMPNKSEQVLGGHDVVICGYDDATRQFKFKNSWGASWGRSGFGWFPYAYVTDASLSGDFWVINAIPGGTPTPPPPPTPGNKVYFTLTFNRDVSAGTTVRLPSFRAKTAIPAGKYDVVSEQPALVTNDDTVSVSTW